MCKATNVLIDSFVSSTTIIKITIEDELQGFDYVLMVYGHLNRFQLDSFGDDLEYQIDNIPKWQTYKECIIDLISTYGMPFAFIDSEITLTLEGV